MLRIRILPRRQSLNRLAALCLIVWGLVVTTTRADDVTSPRERVSFNLDWRFHRDIPGDPTTKPIDTSAFSNPTFDDSSWRRLDLPHDWGIDGPIQQELPGATGKLAWWGEGWYRKHFTIPPDDSDKQIYLDIDGAMSNSTVWLNGEEVGGWPYGYTSYRLDLTPHIKPGKENVLAIRLNNPPASSRWYPGGGIYRNVWLVMTAPIHVDHWGTSVMTTAVSKTAATITVKTNIVNDSAAPAAVAVKIELLTLEDDGVRDNPSFGMVEFSEVPVAASGTAQSSTTMQIPDPPLWTLEKPNRMVAVVTISDGAKILDQDETIFGIRSIALDPEKGFFLNGEHIKIQGVCNHHDLGALGSAVNTRAIERQVELLKEMGCNAIRTSHNPPAPELLDVCDRLGMLVMDEFTDAWEAGKNKNDYSALWPQWRQKDLRALVRRDRNHPSVVFWSIGNEVKEQNTARAAELAGELSKIVREEDPLRFVTGAFHTTTAKLFGLQKTMDLFGFNYETPEYPKFHRDNPTIAVMGSETASCVSSRGEYFFPVSDDKAEGRANFQVSSYDLYAPRWANAPDLDFAALDRERYVIGEFVWTGFDYLGEPTPYNRDVTNLLNFTDETERAKMAAEMKELGKLRVPSRSSYFGIFDLAGFKKDRFYIYQARWRPELPMAHILPHWNWPERAGLVTPVHVYTSGDEAELFLNGRSLGRKKRGQFEYRLRWDDVKYEPGMLRVATYKNGKPWADAEMKTTGSAAKLALQPDRATIAADGNDLSFVTLTIQDAEGLMVPRSKNRISFKVTGPGEIVATDNGDATDFDSFHSHDRRAFNGLCLAIVRSKRGEAGDITVSAESEGLSPAKVTIKTVAK